MSDRQVTRIDAESRYQVSADGELLGFAAFQTTPELVVFTHTEVFPGSEARGVGGALVRGALDDVRTLGLKALPVCPFVQAWLDRHPAYADLDYRSSRPASSEPPGT